MWLLQFTPLVAFLVWLVIRRIQAARKEAVGLYVLILTHLVLTSDCIGGGVVRSFKRLRCPKGSSISLATRPGSDF